MKKLKFLNHRNHQKLRKPPKAPEEMSDEEIEVEVIGDADRKTDKEVRIKKGKKEKYKAGKYSRWAGLNLGFNQLRDSEDILHSKEWREIWDNKIWGSRTWNINLFEFSLSIVKRHILLTTGSRF